MRGIIASDDGRYAAEENRVCQLRLRDLGERREIPAREVFRDIKRAYESYIIVGWALDIKGMPPKISMELEAVHREQFGGAHQVLFLLDSMERDEFFYITCKNHLRQKQGFYIYYEPEYVRRVDVELETLDRNERENASDWRISDHIPDWRVDNEETTQERRMEKRCDGTIAAGG